MSNDDLAYYRYRAATETEMAAQATLPQVVAAHYELANAYFDRIASTDEEGPRDTSGRGTLCSSNGRR